MYKKAAKRVELNCLFVYCFDCLIDYVAQLLCYMPKLDASKNARKKKKFKNFKRQLYHDVWYKLLKPVREAQNKGGFRALWKGRS
jgi:hypothetical protein